MSETKLLAVLILENKIEDVYKAMMEFNSQFASFVKDNESKSIEEIAMEYDINLNLLEGNTKCIEI